MQHIVVVMMENRSFDHMLGWLPGATGRQAGLSYADASGVRHPTYPLAPDYQGCGLSDPDHSHQGGLVEYNNGACDGWLRAGANDRFCIGYYQQSDLAFLGQAAPAWTTCDQYFAATLAETYPNRVYQHAAQTDRLVNSLNISTLPTIWDRLAEQRIQGRYYFTDRPLPRAVGRQVCGDQPAGSAVSGRLRGGHAPGGFLRRPELCAGGNRPLERRPSRTRTSATARSS